MNKFILEPEEILPGIRFDQEKGKLEIYGKSCPIDAHNFYEPMQKWIDEYMENPQDLTIMEINLSYFNTVSAKAPAEALMCLVVMGDSHLFYRATTLPLDGVFI